ncbi:hypothetical protein [Hamadaea tsunoensis]|uniref:hypothetical protein n=1 Tax=Hamadaea tsunoensis TaxID=53368 RepID=UPI00041C0FA4|nr:hypothetical protein [Hamadaea tsunoensis]
MINWQDIQNPTFVERVAKAALKRQHPAARGIDGSGGDGGRDCVWDSPDGLVIFEIKSFTARLSTKQKRNIEKSLLKALQHDPIRWELVIPLDPCPTEETWFTGLKKAHPGIKLVWNGRDWFDSQMAMHPDLREYLEGVDSRLLARARTMKLEKEVLAGGLPDLGGRLADLTRIAAERFPGHQVSFTSGPDGLTITASNNEVGLASEQALDLDTSFYFPDDDADAQSVKLQFKEFRDYGGQVIVPDRYVNRENPRWVDYERFWGQIGTGSDALELRSVPDSTKMPLPVQLILKGPDQIPKARLDMRLTHRVQGLRGGIVMGSDLMEVLHLEMRRDLATPTRSGVLRLELNALAGKWSYTAEAVAEFIVQSTPEDTLTVNFGPTAYASAPVGETFDDMREVAQLIVALNIIQKHTNVHFAVPAELTHADIRMASAVAQLLEVGEAVLVERTYWVGVKPDHVADFLAEISTRMIDDKLAIYAIRPEQSFEVVGQHVDVGRTSIYGGKVCLVNRRELEAYQAGNPPPRAQFTCLPGEHLVGRRHDGEGGLEVRALEMRK